MNLQKLIKNYEKEHPNADNSEIILFLKQFGYSEKEIKHNLFDNDENYELSSLPDIDPFDLPEDIKDDFENDRN